MKKTYAIIALLIFAASCSSPSTNREAAAPANSAATATPASLTISEADAIAKEKAIWETLKNKDYDTFATMLADDEVEVAADGVHNKAASVAAVKQFEPTEVTFTDWKFLPIDKDAFVLVYTVTTKGKYKGKEIPPEPVRGSSAWVQRGGKWLAMYHQECAVNTSPPPPPAAGGSPAKPPATPPSTASPAPAPTDPLGLEKALWDTLKNKDYDGFAAYLAPEALEVEPNGVFDKAGSVREVRNFDLSRAQLSEFKSVAFDADAELVTYLVKLPGPAPAERHSTIWAKRGGKWLALFHHGTPIARVVAAPTPTPKPAAATPSPK